MADPGSDIVSISQVAMMAHTASVANQAELRVHREECSATRLRNESIFADIRQNIRSLDTKMSDSAKEISEKMDEKYEELKLDVNASNKWLYMIVGGITLIGVLIEKIPLSIHL